MMSLSEIKIPKLKTAQTNPLHPLEQSLLDRQDAIETWFHQQWQKTPPPVYGSVDLRNANVKLAPVDMNLYPAGFNNLNPESLPLAIQSAQALLKQRYPRCQSIMIIPENHSRNLFYWENIDALFNILHHAGFVVRIGGDADAFPEKKVVELTSGRSVTIETTVRKNNRLLLKNFDPDIIWLNNDLSAGIPEYLKNIEQPICPPIELGWHSRLKSVHFAHYREVIIDFAKSMQIDPWFLDPLFRSCGNIDFMQHEGQECLATNVEKLLTAIQKKYDEYHIPHQPFVIVKADAGTYGMSVMSVKSAAEILHLNRKQRKQMSATKGSQSVHRVIIQEGVYSFETWGEENMVAEPVIYLLGQYVIGGFYRLHRNKSSSESLNAPGMTFVPLQSAKPSQSLKEQLTLDEYPDRFYAYSVVARLSQLAAAREQAKVQKS